MPFWGRASYMNKDCPSRQDFRTSFTF